MHSLESYYYELLSDYPYDIMFRCHNPWFSLLAYIRPILKKRGITNVAEVSSIAKKYYSDANKDLDIAIKLFNESIK